MYTLRIFKNSFQKLYIHFFIWPVLKNLLNWHQFNHITALQRKSRSDTSGAMAKNESPRSYWSIKGGTKVWRAVIAASWWIYSYKPVNKGRTLVLKIAPEIHSLYKLSPQATVSELTPPPHPNVVITFSIHCDQTPDRRQLTGGMFILSHNWVKSSPSWQGRHILLGTWAWECKSRGNLWESRL